MDLVKTFLLKSTHMDRVIINNITFSTENYEVIRNTIGATVLDHLEMVLNTFEVLIEYEWKYEVSRESVVHWDELRLAKSGSQSEMTPGGRAAGGGGVSGGASPRSPLRPGSTSIPI